MMYTKYKFTYLDAACVGTLERNYGAVNVAPTLKDKSVLSSERRPHFKT
jgi:hypothetical protein